AFLIPYLVMLVFSGFPLFYMELALGQYQRCGCITVWKRICPVLKGIGFGICIIATYVSWYYNTIISWALFYFFSSMRADVPWKTCNNTWNTNMCMDSEQRRAFFAARKNVSEELVKKEVMNYTTPNEEFFEKEVLGLSDEYNMNHLGSVRWQLALCLMGVFTIVYFAMWKGVKSSGKAVWITATMPYVVLIILLGVGVSLEGAGEGIKYFITPTFARLGDYQVWVDAAAQIFFSLGPGFGVLLALSSYNKFTNNCFRDALITSGINCGTSFLAGFAVFAVLGHMAHVQNTDIEYVAREDVGLIFIVYPEAISNLKGSSVWAVIFFFMLITLGLDTTFGGLEAIATGILDEWPFLRKRRELFILGLMAYCFLGSLATTTYGGIYLVQLLDTYGAPIALLFIVCLEAIAVTWIYGATRFSHDIEAMLGPQSDHYWRFWKTCWMFIAPTILFVLFILSLVMAPVPQYSSYVYPEWSIAIGWMMVVSSLLCIPAYAIYKFLITPGSVVERIRTIMIPEESPTHIEELRVFV
ncbi:sodium-dependent serotonin transporter-like, partial [Ruditapes philippinarum]|uniref:sodium-dependent serotonin transporter-like n=1 Tax=Ruditapes philippinarum TaxID=129788 RepID=UPI00295A678C